MKLSIVIGGCALFGLAIGSFLNVVVYRVPRHESIVKPPSRCPACGVIIRSRDNVPLVSWFLLRGKCRNCSSRISGRYPLLEGLCAALFAGTGARFGWSSSLLPMLILLAGLLALAAIDLERMILPKSIVYVSFVVLALTLVTDSLVTSQWHRLAIAFACSASWFVVFFAINALGPRLLGYGDVRLALLLGLGLGWLGIRFTILGFFAANLIGAVIGVSLILAKRMTRDQPIPYGVFLAMGAALAIFAGPELLSPFQRFS